MKRIALITLMVPVLLAGCGKTESTVTDTAVTETISLSEPEAQEVLPASEPASGTPQTEVAEPLAEAEE